MLNKRQVNVSGSVCKAESSDLELAISKHYCYYSSGGNLVGSYSLQMYGLLWGCHLGLWHPPLQFESPGLSSTIFWVVLQHL